MLGVSGLCESDTKILARLKCQAHTPKIHTGKRSSTGGIMSSNSITITACDNELLLIAYQWGSSYVLADIKSGNDQPVNVTLNIVNGQFDGTLTLNGVNSKLDSAFQIPLAPGSYSLAAVGVNWGGPTRFSFTFNGKQYSAETAPWTPAAINFTV
jgi:hypothetical protein